MNLEPIATEPIETGFSRRNFLELAGLAGVAAALAACGEPSQSNDVAPPTTTPGTTPDATPSAEQTQESAESHFASTPSWEQDFTRMKDGTELDDKFWNIVSGKEEAGYNDEAETNTGRAKNLRIEGGALIMEAHKERRDGQEYTSARINTQGKKAFTYGKIEVDCKMPVDAKTADDKTPEAVGTWPALWLLYDDLEKGTWPANGEIDFGETVGFERNKLIPAIHTTSTEANHQDDLGSVKVPTMYSDFNTYGVQLSPGKIEFTLNGKVYKTREKQPDDGPDEWPFDDNEYSLIMDLAMGGSWGGQKRDKAHPDGIVGDGPWTMAIEAVRFYDYEPK